MSPMVGSSIHSHDPVETGDSGESKPEVCKSSKAAAAIDWKST